VAQHRRVDGRVAVDDGGRAAAAEELLYGGVEVGDVGAGDLVDCGGAARGVGGGVGGLESCAELGLDGWVVGYVLYKPGEDGCC